ncbi:hypothetical protein Asfd1_51 [Aeromonas phage Asfd_1]|nr:hypothetical protein Asfd1_51 [Aeromonas phage Asfd_1]
MKYRFVSEEQFNAWAKQKYAKEFAPHFVKWNDVFETVDLECEIMADDMTIHGKWIASTEFYPFMDSDIGTRIEVVEE